jgi:predicted nuclease of restriction endonuclease-like (RecB) superfamily
LSWIRLREIIYLDDPLQREFYAQMCRTERCSPRTLQDKIQGMLYERTATSRKPDYLARLERVQIRTWVTGMLASARRKLGHSLGHR